MDILKNILKEISETIDFVRNENNLRFRIEIALVFILMGIVFMTALYLYYAYEYKATPAFVAEATVIPEIKPYNLMQIQYNITPLEREKEDIKYIVVHDTCNTDVGANAINHYNFFNSENQKSSADFFVDSDIIIQTNDYYKYYSWHCGDGGASAKINNRNSVGVEICINRDGDYLKSVENAIILIRILMKELDIKADHIVRHYDASGKDCPMTMDTRDWKYFLERVSKNKNDSDYIMSYAR